MNSPPAVRPDATPDTAQRALTVEVRHDDGTPAGCCSEAEADQILAAGLGEWRGGHRPHIRLAAAASASHHHGGRRTWYGPLRPGVDGPARYSHAHEVCAGYRR